jgi:outer membrane protein assembly factor BamB
MNPAFPAIPTIFMRRSLLLILLLLPAARPEPDASDADWPMWRHDAARSGTTTRALPERLQLQWTRELPPLHPGWPDQPRVQMDAVYEPVVLGKLLYVPSPRHDGVSAYDTRSGAERWTVFTDGPVRYAPVAWENRLYFASDDGCLYCLDAQTGRVAWKFRGGPAERLILGNERLINTWPARGAPVIADGVVYFGAGIWPFMGIFLYALDARSGAVVWANEGDGSIYMQQPHNVDAFAGVAPQGPMVVTGDNLLVTGGRSVPACYDRKTGKLKFFKFAENGRRGGADVSTAAGLFFAGGLAYDLATGLYVSEFSRPLAVSAELFCYTGKAKDILVAKPPTMSVVESVDRKGAKVLKNQWKMAPPDSVETPTVTALVRAGNRLYAGSEGRITAVALGGPKPKELWRLAVDGTPGSLIAADDRLFVVTREGKIHCYGADTAPPRSLAWTPTRPEFPPADLDYAMTDGYAVWIGDANLKSLLEMIEPPGVRLIAFTPDAANVDRARGLLANAGLYGDRVAVRVGDASIQLPPYLASTIVCDTGPLRAETARRLYESLRPYGGRLHVLKKLVNREDLDRWVSEGSGAAAAVEETGPYYTVIRAGALPGAGNWTHEHADAANTRVSKDTRVRAPLGLLWFGGPSHEGILPRHGHGPEPQILDGRLFIEGVDVMRATDIYTGRLLWETPLPGVGDFYNNVLHQPGANATGTNFVSTPDGIYVAWKSKCVRLDPATGHVLSEFDVPGGPTDWSAITVSDDYLVGATDPIAEIFVPKKTEGGLDEPQSKLLEEAVKKVTTPKVDNDARSSSRQIFVMDRHSGRVLWQAVARLAFRHNSICIGGGRLYIIDRLSGLHLERLKKKGEPNKVPAMLVAFDLKDGSELWRSEDGIFGTFLSYSEAHDVLVECGRVARDTVTDEPKEMRTWKAAEGKPIWKKGYSGPGMIHGDTILLGEAKACDLMTGAPRGRIHPITGLPVEWTWARNYGCNTPAASEHLLTFRSGAAGYFDLAGDGGTGNFGGFKSGCTNNLLVAGGLVNAPDYTRTCICSYQNQASLALVPMPEAEMWTFFGNAEIKGAIKRIGVNFGAPGDRRAEDGTLWVEHPSVGGKSPTAPITMDGAVEYLRKHSSRLSGEGLPWVAASAVKGLSSLILTLDMDAKSEAPYTIRLTFAELEGLKPGERVFDVALQGRDVLKDFDIAREAGGSDRSLVREFTVPASRDVRLSMTPHKGLPLLCGMEVFAGGELPVVKNVFNSDLTVPETAPPKPPVEEPHAGGEELPVRSLLWIGMGALVFMYLFFRLAILKRRST